MSAKIEKVSIIVSKGSLEGVSPGLIMANGAGGVPGVSSVMTRYMNHKMEQLDIPSVPEFVEMIADTDTDTDTGAGAGLYACKASADLFGLTKADLIDQ